jgi:hypothetical protein
MKLQMGKSAFQAGGISPGFASLLLEQPLPVGLDKSGSVLRS